MTTLSTPTPAPSQTAQPRELEQEHVLSPWALLTVFGGLFALTILTVLVARVNLGAMNIWIALLIATAKASLVLLYFMHLRYDSPFYSIIIISALIFVVAFIAGAIVDSLNYRVNFAPPSAMTGAP